MSCAVINKNSPQEVEIFRNHTPVSGFASDGLSFVFQRIPEWQITQAIRRASPLDLTTTLSPQDLLMATWYFFCTSPLALEDPRVPFILNHIGINGHHADQITEINKYMGAPPDAVKENTISTPIDDLGSFVFIEIESHQVELTASISNEALLQAQAEVSSTRGILLNGVKHPSQLVPTPSRAPFPCVNINAATCCKLLKLITDLAREHPVQFSAYRNIDLMLRTAKPTSRNCSLRAPMPLAHLEMAFAADIDYEKEVSKIDHRQQFSEFQSMIYAMSGQASANSSRDNPSTRVQIERFLLNNWRAIASLFLCIAALVALWILHSLGIINPYIPDGPPPF